jgi:uncharacterized protein YbjT (DUF2867 family)
MIAVIGAESAVGRALVDVLGDRIGEPATASTVIDVADAGAQPRGQRIRAEVLAATRRALDAAESAGARHFVLVSSAGLGRPAEEEHFSARLGAEALVEASPIPHTIVRTTPLRETVERLATTGLHRDRVHGRIVIRPIPAHDVATEVAAMAVDPPRRMVVSLAGPDRFHLDDLVEVVRLARFHHREAWAHPPVVT